MAKPTKKITLSDYKAIASQFHEEEPLYQCVRCFRETAYGSDTIKHGIICYGISKGICAYCNGKLTKIENS